MKRKKVIFSSNRIRVSKEINGELYFEIENELTSDLSEAVAMVMNFGITDKEFLETTFNVNINNISPDKTLYWLSGGDKEWVTKNHYSKAWSDVYLSYQEEFGLMIINIIKKSKTLGDVMNGFTKYLNLSTLYEFSLEKGYLK